MPNFALESFVRLMPKQGYDEWSFLIKKMSDFCKEAEYEMVKGGYRRAATMHIGEENYKEMTEKINKDGLIFTPIIKTALYDGQSHIHKKPEEGKPFTWYGCVTKTYKDGQEFKKADGSASNKKPNHKKTGELLGYPDCCIDYFSKNFKKNYDPLWVERNGLVEGYPECNRLLRYFGVQVSYHFSCSPKCEKTREIGEKYLEIMRKKDVVLAKKIYDLLSTEMTWDSYHGVVQVETPYFVGVSNTFPYLEKKRVINWKIVKK